MKTTFILLILCLIVSGCGRPGASPLLLYCGAGIRLPVSEIAQVFEKEKGVKMECIYNGSNILFGQIKLTRKGDIFIPGEVFYVEQAKTEGLIEDSRIAAYFVPVILVQKGNPKKISGLGSLTKKGLRLGIGDTRACAIGMATEKLLGKNNIPLSKIKPNIVFTSVTVNELADAVKLGHIDAAIVWDGTAHYYSKDSDIITIPEKKNVISSIPVAVLTTSDNKTAAREFLEWTVSKRGREIFKKHNFTTILKEEGRL